MRMSSLVHLLEKVLINMFSIVAFNELSVRVKGKQETLFSQYAQNLAKSVIN